MAKKTIVKCRGKKIEITPVKVDRSEDQFDDSDTMTAPGGGEIEIPQPELSADSIETGQPVKCKVIVKGQAIAHIFQESMLQVGDKLVGPLTRDYLRSASDRQVKGITRPRWEAVNQIEFESLPRLDLLYCGTSFTLACLSPVFYGVTPENQIWALEGIYQRGGGEPFRVKLEFDADGRLVNKTGYYPTAHAEIAVPFALLFEEGDTFEPYVTLTSSDGSVTLATASPVMLSDGNALRVEKAQPPKGVFQIGIAVEDFDGQVKRSYTPLTMALPAKTD